MHARVRVCVQVSLLDSSGCSLTALSAMTPGALIACVPVERCGCELPELGLTPSVLCFPWLLVEKRSC